MSPCRFGQALFSAIHDLKVTGSKSCPLPNVRYGGNRDHARRAAFGAQSGHSTNWRCRTTNGSLGGPSARLPQNRIKHLRVTPKHPEERCESLPLRHLKAASRKTRKIRPFCTP